MTPQTSSNIGTEDVRKQPADKPSHDALAFNWKLWIYTNYDCNLCCSYCVAKSSPHTPRRGLGLESVRRVVDEAVKLGFVEIYFTGGEPFILRDIYEMLAYSSTRLKTLVLTNGILLKGKRLEQLKAIANENLTIQVSLDGAQPEQHDPYRGSGTWTQTVESIARLQGNGFHLRLSTTETPANSPYLDEICEFHHSLGISDNDHFIRPLAKRGFSKEGLEIDMMSILPEVTVNVDGVFWHPLSTEADMQVSRNIFPLADAVEIIQEQLQIIAGGGQPLITFT